MCCREVGSKERGVNSSTKYAIEERNLQSSYILPIYTDILLSFEHRGQNYFFFETVVKVVSSFCKDKKRGSIYLNTY